MPNKEINNCIWYFHVTDYATIENGRGEMTVAFYLKNFDT